MSLKIRPNYSLILVCIVTSLILSCSNEQNSSVSADNLDELIDKDIEVEEGLLEKGVQEKLDVIIKDLKLSDDMIVKISENSEVYNEELLNSVKKAREYNMSYSKAVNMGIYGAELNYIIHFNQTQNSFRYLVVAKQMADELGVALAFDQKVMEEYQNNMQNRDSLLTIVNNAYSNVRKYLKNGEQFLVSALVIAGSWTENIYLVLNQLNEIQMQDQREELISSICNQKAYLANIIDLLETLNDNAGNAYVKDFISGLNDISDVFSKFATENKPTQEEMNLLRDKLTDVRNNVTLNK